MWTSFRPESDNVHSPWVHNHHGTQWFINQVAQLVLEYFIALAMQPQRQQCIIYCVHFWSSLHENSGRISISDSNTECMQIDFEFKF